VLVGVPVGVISAVKQYSLLDKVTSVLALTGISMPIFWLAMILVVIFTVNLGLLPFPGRLSSGVSITAFTGLVLVDSLLTGNFAGFWDGLSHLILPALALGTIPMAVVTRMTRSSMLEVMNEDYVRTARAKGVVPWRVISKHALRNAMLPIVTVLGLSLPGLIGGSVIVESVFAIPGMGQLMVQAVYERDYPVIMGNLVIVSTLTLFANLIADLTYSLVDPRIRVGSRRSRR
jgi:ABC-type dipeptide/oligopeptide/nickel transport system permease component